MKNIPRVPSRGSSSPFAHGTLGPAGRGKPRRERGTGLEPTGGSAGGGWGCTVPSPPPPPVARFNRVVTDRSQVRAVPLNRLLVSTLNLSHTRRAEVPATNCPRQRGGGVSQQKTVLRSFWYFFLNTDTGFFHPSLLEVLLFLMGSDQAFSLRFALLEAQMCVI